MDVRVVSSLLALVVIGFAGNSSAAELEDKCPGIDDPGYAEAHDYGPIEERFWDLEASQLDDWELLYEIRKACWAETIGEDSFDQYSHCHNVATPTQTQWAPILECTLTRSSKFGVDLKVSTDPFASGKEQTSEGISLTAAARMLIDYYYAEHKSFPSNNAEADLPNPRFISTRYVESVEVIAGGKILISYSSETEPLIRGTQLTLVPKLENGKVDWACGSATFRGVYLPDFCE